MKAILKSISITTGVVFAIFLLAPLVNAQSVTNSPAFEPIVFVDVPLDVAIQALAREVDVNYLIDPRIIRWWHPSPDKGNEDHMPIENLRLTNATPKEALELILRKHHFVLLEDPQTGVARVTYPNQVIQPLDTGLERFTTNQPAQLEPIQFTDVPLDVCLQALAREAGINYLLDPRIGWGTPDKNGVIRQPPTLTYRWEHITPAQGFFALCENYGFEAEQDAFHQILFVRAKGHPISICTNLAIVNSGTNSSGNLKFDNTPIDIALQALANKAHLRITLDPKISQSGNLISLQLHNVSILQLFIGLCESCNLSLTQGDDTGDITINLPETVPLVHSPGNG